MSELKTSHVEILRMLASGSRQYEIATHLRMSLAAFNAELIELLKALHVETLCQAVFVATSAGVLDRPVSCFAGLSSLGVKQQAELSEDHLELLRGIAGGESISVWSMDRRIPMHVINRQIKEIKDKLRAKDLCHLIANTLRLGLIEPVHAKIDRNRISRKQIQLMEQMAAGRSQIEIAEANGESVKTVRARAAKLRIIIGANTSPHAVMILASVGLIKINEEKGASL